MADRAFSDHIILVEDTPTVDTNAYATGDLIGPKIELSAAVLGSSGQGLGGSGLIESVGIIDLAAQEANIDVAFFDTDPSNTTFTDNSAFDPHDTDIKSLIGVVSVTDWKSFSDNSYGQALNLALPFVLSTGTSLFAALISRGAPTYGASDLTLRVTVLQH